MINDTNEPAGNEPVKYGNAEMYTVDAGNDLLH